MLPLNRYLFIYLLFIYLLNTATRYDNCWQKHSNCISLYYFVDHVHNVSKKQSNPLGSEQVPTKPVTFRTKKVLTASNILLRNSYISGYCYILRQKLLHHLLATWGQPWECSVYYRIARRCFTDEIVWFSWVQGCKTKSKCILAVTPVIIRVRGEISLAVVFPCNPVWKGERKHILKMLNSYSFGGC